MTRSSSGTSTSENRLASAKRVATLRFNRAAYSGSVAPSRQDRDYKVPLPSEGCSLRLRRGSNSRMFTLHLPFADPVSDETERRTHDPRSRSGPQMNRRSFRRLTTRFTSYLHIRSVIGEVGISPSLGPARAALRACADPATTPVQRGARGRGLRSSSSGRSNSRMNAAPKFSSATDVAFVFASDASMASHTIIPAEHRRISSHKCIVPAGWSPAPARSNAGWTRHACQPARMRP